MQLSKLPFALCLAASLSACVVDDGDTDTDAGTGTDPSTTSPTTTSPTTTDPVTTDPVTTEPGTETGTESGTTAPGTETGTESESETDVSTSVDPDSTGTDTGTVGDCGWDKAMEFYVCGGDGEDPKGNFPLECTEEPVAGAECDENSAINGIGCCFAGGNAFCGKDGTVQIDDSCAAG
jgi:hypothetical protein